MYKIHEFFYFLVPVCVCFWFLYACYESEIPEEIGKGFIEFYFEAKYMPTQPKRVVMAIFDPINFSVRY